VLDATAGFLARVTVWTSRVSCFHRVHSHNSAGAMGCTLPTITSANVGLQLCFRIRDAKRVRSLSPRSIHLLCPFGAVGSAAGTLVSGGAPGDAARVVAVDTDALLLLLSAWELGSNN